jgi:hypothetical protein
LKLEAIGKEHSMKMLAAILLSFALLWPAAALAQDEFIPLPAPFCGGLSDPDCQLLTDSQELMRYVSSMRSALVVKSGLVGIPDIADEDMMFDMTMDMTMHLDPALSETMRAATQGEGAASSMAELSDLIVEFYETLEMDIEMQMSLPRILRDAIEADEGLVFPANLFMRVRMVDGYVYIDTDALAESFPQLRADLESARISGWIGFDMAGQLAQQMAIGDEPVDDSMLQSVQTSMVFNQLIADETVRALLEPYVTVERLDDEERNGESVAVFATSVNLARLVTRPEFTQLLRQAAEGVIAASGESVDQQELGMAILGIQLLSNMLARSFTFEILQVVGIDTPYLHDYSLFVQFDLSSLLTFLAMSGEEIPPELRGAIPIFTLDVDASYSDFDAAPAIEKPAGARIMPLDSLDEESINLIS